MLIIVSNYLLFCHYCIDIVIDRSIYLFCLPMTVSVTYYSSYLFNSWTIVIDWYCGIVRIEGPVAYSQYSGNDLMTMTHSLLKWALLLTVTDIYWR